jgi:hypothetical protein
MRRAFAANHAQRASTPDEESQNSQLGAPGIVPPPGIPRGATRREATHHPRRTWCATPYCSSTSSFIIITTTTYHDLLAVRR